MINFNALGYCSTLRFSLLKEFQRLAIIRFAQVDNSNIEQGGDSKLLILGAVLLEIDAVGDLIHVNSENFVIDGQGGVKCIILTKENQEQSAVSAMYNKMIV